MVPRSLQLVTPGTSYRGRHIWCRDTYISVKTSTAEVRAARDEDIVVTSTTAPTGMMKNKRKSLLEGIPSLGPETEESYNNPSDRIHLVVDSWNTLIPRTGLLPRIARVRSLILFKCHL